MAIKALFAVWGALANGNPNEAQAADVGGRLQQLFNEGVTTVTINDNNFGDPSVGFQKHFAATVNNKTGNGVAHSSTPYDGTARHAQRRSDPDPTDQTATSANNPVNVSARFVTPQQVKLLSKFTSVGVNDVSSVL